MKINGKLIITGALLSLFVATAVQAQAVFLARKALGAVQHITSSIVDSAGRTQNSEAATVLLEADADKVYATALKVIKDNRKLRIINSDTASRTIDFSDGERKVVMKVSPFQDNIAQILVSASSATGKTADAYLVVDGILLVCRDLNVHCSTANN